MLEGHFCCLSMLEGHARGHLQFHVGWQRCCNAMCDGWRFVDIPELTGENELGSVLTDVIFTDGGCFGRTFNSRMFSKWPQGTVTHSCF